MAASIASTPAEALLQNWGLQYERVEEYPIADVLDEAGQQVRDLNNIANRFTVDEYHEQLVNGAEYPPIVLRSMGNGRGSMVDGNTRRATFIKAGRTTIPALLVNLPSQAMCRALGAALNEQNGVRLTSDEAMRAALDMMSEELHFTDGQIARAVGRSLAQVRQWRDAQGAKEHAERLGLADVFARIPANQHRTLNKVVLDAPFKAAVELAGSRRIKNAEVSRMVKEITTAPSEEDALAIVRSVDDDTTPSGPDATAVIRNEKARRARMILPQIVNLAPVEELYELERVEEDRKMWNAVKFKVDTVLEYFDRVQGGER